MYKAIFINAVHTGGLYHYCFNCSESHFVKENNHGSGFCGVLRAVSASPGLFTALCQLSVRRHGRYSRHCVDSLPLGASVHGVDVELAPS